VNRYAPWPEGAPDELERELLETWKTEGLFELSLAERAGGRRFVFFEGPPTANGRPGIHHVFSRTVKDLVCRFRAMQGLNVTRIGGWDTHGLPVEIEVEKRLELNGKRDIEAFGVERFNALCRESVFAYRDDWVALSDRIGFWLDYDNAYITCSNEYIESVWSLLKRLHLKDMLYQGHRVLPYCPRCGTVLSSHELALGYEEVQDRSIYVACRLEDGSDRELVVWTTTPWTLPSNVAIAVHPELEYGTYRLANGRRLIVATNRAVILDSLSDTPPVCEETFLGDRLVGLRYHRPLDVVRLPEAGVHSIVVQGNFVTAEEGSGLVHMAPAFGADDFAAGQRDGLAFLRPVSPEGKFTGTTWEALEGTLVTAEETNSLIIKRLKDDGRLLRTDQHTHPYPHCWRCQSKLIYYARESWFVRTTSVRDRMLEVNAQVGWYPPEVGSGRFGEWLSNNVDWALSRDRYWGTPLPVWVADDDPDCVEVIGSYQELAQRIGRALPEGFDPHKPFIDQYTWPSPGGGTMRRVPEVIDTWFDSGSMPYAQWHQPFENQEKFEANFPADFICEGVDQTRGWFYSLLAIAVAAFDTMPYRNVVVNEMVLDADGQKMAKSRGNAVDPGELISAFGADTIRLYLLASSEVWKPKRFDRRVIPEVAGGFLNTLRNAYAFLALYGTAEAVPPEGSRSRIDRWLLASLQETVNEVVDAWEQYQITAGTKAIMRFVVDDLSNWYIRLSRSRFWAPDRDADPVAVETLRTALEVVSRLLAPAAPYASDRIHRALTGRSVHLAAFPERGVVGEAGLRTGMGAVRTLASLARAAREQVGIRVRQPLETLRVAVPSAVRGPEFDALLPLLAQEVNVRAVELVGAETDLVTLSGKANYRSLGRRYGRETPIAAKVVSLLDPERLRALESGATIGFDHDGRRWEYYPEDVTVVREVATDWVVESAGPYIAAINPKITPALQCEGLARELVNRVQRLRKDVGYAYTTRILLAVDGSEEVQSAVRAHRDLIQGETLARHLELGPPSGPTDRVEQATIDNHAVTIAIGQVAEPAPAANP